MMHAVVLSLALQIGSAFVAPHAAARTLHKPLNSVHMEQSEAGLLYIDLTSAGGATSKIFALGADVVSYVDVDKTEWIAVRPDAKMDGSKPISGGLSHCFPQFGPGEIQQHGFARNLDWDVLDFSEFSVTFELRPNEVTKAMWDKPFVIQYKVEISDTCLDTTVTVVNEGTTDAFDFQAALHSYFDVSSLKATTIGGSFKGASYMDKMQSPPATVTETRDEIAIAEEYDRVYMGVNDPVLKDTGKGKKLIINNSAGWADTVLWSPYGNEGMGYDKFVCVESAAFTPVTLEPQAAWAASMTLTPEKL